MAAPTINITNSPGLTLIDAAESTTGWVGFNDGAGGNPGVSSDALVFIQGSASNSIKVSGTNQDKGMWFDEGSGIDMTVTGRHLYMWMQMTTVVNMFIQSAGGMYIKVASDVAGDNWNKYYISGRGPYPGGWVRFVIDLNKTPSETAVTPATLTSIRHFGAGVNSTGSSVAENFYIDRIDYGDGLQIEAGDSGDPATWQALFEEDDAVANKYGIITKKEGVFFVKGGLAIGDASSSVTTLWDDSSGSIVVFEDPLYHNGTARVSAIDAPNLYKIDFVGNGTGTTDIDFGSVVGTGDDRQGILGGTISSAGPKWALDAETDISDLDTVNLFGVALERAAITKFSGSTKTDIIGCVFTECDEIQPNDAEFLNNTIISPVPRRGVEILTGNNTQQNTFVAGSSSTQEFARVLQVETSPLTINDETDNANSSATNDWLLFTAIEQLGDYCAMGSQNQFEKMTIDLFTNGTSGDVEWEYWSGSAWSTLDETDFLVDGTGGLSSGGDVTFKAPKDWASTSIQDEDPLYYIRAAVTDLYSTNPIGTKGSISDRVQMLTHVPVAGTFTYDALKFFGSPTAHVENSANATTEDSYADSNQDATTTFNDGTTDGVAQSFTGAGGDLSRLRVMLAKTGSPTGTLTARIYAHSGVFGTSSIPTGPILAESETIDIADLSTLAFVDFEFEDEFTLVNTTKYVWALEKSTGGVSDNIQIGTDTSSPSHGGNFATLATPTWTAVSGTDAIFFAYTGAIVTVNAVAEADPSTDDNTGVPPGATIIVNTVVIEITGVTEGAQCSILADTGGPEDVGTILMNQAADTAGEATTTYNFSTNQPVILRARSSGIIAAAITDDGGTETDETEVARDRATTNDVTLFPAVPVVNVDQYYFGGLTQFDKLTVRVGTAGIGTYVLIWEYWNGAWVTLTTTQADDFKSIGDNLITFSKPGDWATTSVNSQGPFYYLRTRWTSGTMTTSPIGNNASMSVTKYLPFSQTDTITSSGLSVKATWVVDSTAC